MRWILALYHVSWLIFIFVDYPTPRCYFFIYLTQWSFVVLTATTVVWCAVETLAYVKFVKEGYITKRVGWSLKLLWTLQNITLMPAFFVSLVYWIFLFEPGAWRYTYLKNFDMVSYQVCSMPSYLCMSVVVVLVNTMLCRLYLYRVYRFIHCSVHSSFVIEIIKNIFFCGWLY